MPSDSEDEALRLLVEAVAEAVNDRSPDVGLRWADANTVRINATHYVPGEKTRSDVLARRVLFRRALCQALIRRGWLPTENNWYRQGPPGSP